MKHREMDILHQDLDIPETVWQKAEDAFEQIREERGEEISMRDSRAKNCRFGRYFPKAAVIILAGFLASGATVAATSMISAYRERLENMEEQELDTYYMLTDAGETNEYNRQLTEEELKRFYALEEEYENEGRFPEKDVPWLSEPGAYDGKELALDPNERTFYLPERDLSDEELLEIIDFNHKSDYSVVEHNDRILNGTDWMKRMAEMSDDEVDAVYLAMFASNLDVSGGYSRQLSGEEKQREAELVRKYEEEGLYTDAELAIIESPEEYTGSGVALCVADSTYYIHEGELTDSEFLQIIDFNHKVTYSCERIFDDIEKGFRQGYPKAEGR